LRASPQRAGKISGLRARDQVHDNFRVAVGLENRAAMLELAAPLGGVGEVAMWPRGDFALVAINHDGLRVEERLSPAVE